MLSDAREAGDKKIELGRGNTGTEGFGDLWYGGDKTIGGDANYCKEGRCLFDLGVRVFYTTDVLPGASGGQGFTFAMIAGGRLFVPVNTRLSAGGDFKLPELLAYAGNSQENSTPTYLDTTGNGLNPLKWRSSSTRIPISIQSLIHPWPTAVDRIRL